MSQTLKETRSCCAKSPFRLRVVLEKVGKFTVATEGIETSVRSLIPGRNRCGADAEIYERLKQREFQHDEMQRRLALNLKTKKVGHKNHSRSAQAEGASMNTLIESTLIGMRFWWQ